MCVCMYDGKRSQTDRCSCGLLIGTFTNGERTFTSTWRESFLVKFSIDIVWDVIHKDVGGRLFVGCKFGQEMGPHLLLGERLILLLDERDRQLSSTTGLGRGGADHTAVLHLGMKVESGFELLWEDVVADVQADGILVTTGDIQVVLLVKVGQIAHAVIVLIEGLLVGRLVGKVGSEHRTTTHKHFADLIKVTVNRYAVDKVYHSHL
mmetsp:Transcript_23286/g.58240  ORF Transcript_23286/g.58240 Transcript_23286/m.58240 type:complete len:207 (+) Transcript_23286:612-1232(+)